MIIYAIIVITLLVFLLAYKGIQTATTKPEIKFRPPYKIDRVYKKYVHMEDANKRLTRLGILKRLPKEFFDYKAIIFYIISASVGILMAMLLVSVFDLPGYMSLLGLLGFGFPRLYIKRLIKKENESLAEDILVFINVLTSQVVGGAYIGQSFGACARFVKSKKLKKALHEFEENIAVRKMTLNEALEIFSERFENDDIKSLCMIVSQYEESGHVRDIIYDLKKQITETEAVRYEKEKGRLDRTMTAVLMFMYGSVLVYIIYLFITNVKSFI